MVLSRAGLHVPVIPFNDVVGKGAKESPAQIGSTESKVGTIHSFITILKSTSYAVGCRDRFGEKV